MVLFSCFAGFCGWQTAQFCSYYSPRLGTTTACPASFLNLRGSDCLRGSQVQSASEAALCCQTKHFASTNLRSARSTLARCCQSASEAAVACAHNHHCQNWSPVSGDCCRSPVGCGRGAACARRGSDRVRLLQAVRASHSTCVARMRARRPQVPAVPHALRQRANGHDDHGGRRRVRGCVIKCEGVV